MAAIKISTANFGRFIKEVKKSDLIKFDILLENLKKNEKNSIFNLLRFRRKKIGLSKHIQLKNKFYKELVKFTLLNCHYRKYEFKSIFELIFQFTRVEYICLSYSVRKLIGSTELPSFLVALRKNTSGKRIDFRLMNLYSSSLKEDIQRKYYVAALISKEIEKVFSTHTGMDGNKKYGKLLFTANEERNREVGSELFTCLGAFMKYPPEKFHYCKEILELKIKPFQ